MTLLVIAEAASGYAAGSISENVCAISGRSVLSEYNNALFKRYGLFALRRSESFVREKAEFYISSSVSKQKGFVRISVDSVEISFDNYGFEDTAELKRQMTALAGGINPYILKFCSNNLSEAESRFRKLETEYIICGGLTDEENLERIKDRLFSARFAANLADIYANSDKLAAVRKIALVLLPDAAAELAVFTIASIKASERALEETDSLLAGSTVPILNVDGLDNFGTYEDYLAAFLLLCTEKTKLDRFEKIAEDNLRYADKVDFDFDHYVFGFDMKVNLSKKASAAMFGITRRKRIVSQSFSYK